MVETPARAPWTRRRRPWLIAGSVLLGLLLFVVVGSFFVDEPLRRHLERRANAQMTGYTLAIERLSFHPFTFGIDFYGLVLSQDAHPDPAVARFERLAATVQWRALLRRRLVADFLLDRPVVYVDRRHFIEELRDPTPVKEHGWQDALEALYPLKINEFKVVDGQATYVDQGPHPPLTVSHINVRAGNIRNVFSPERVYPSELAVDALVFGDGKVNVEGNADFMREPHVGVKGRLALSHIDVARFAPILKRYNVTVKRGRLSADGEVEYAPDVKTADLRQVTIDGVALDYVHKARTAEQEKAVARAGVEAARSVGNEPDVLLRLAKFDVVRSTLGYTDEARTPPYRVFLSDASISMANLTNQKTEGAAAARVRGKFMGSGATDVRARFVPAPQSPDLSVEVKVENTDLAAMNELLRAFGGFDVVAGQFSLYSEVRVKDGWVDGYVKPLIRDVRAYDKEQDADKSFGRKLKERLINFAGRLLKNRARKEVATRADISGPVEDVQTRTWPIVARLLKNAFVKAILPGFESDEPTEPDDRSPPASRPG